MLQVSVGLLIVFGGLGFPVLMNVYSNVKYHALVFIRKMQRKRTPVKPEQKNISTRIVLFMTTLLVVGGAGLYFLFESDKGLGNGDIVHRIIISFFGSISARTAGFNIIDLSRWCYPTVFLMIVD